MTSLGTFTDAEVRGSYRLAWHASSSVTLSPQPYPFVEGALAHPLKSVVQNVHMGSMVEMQLRLVDQSTSTAGQACRVSVRLQGTYDGGQEVQRAVVLFDKHSSSFNLEVLR